VTETAGKRTAARQDDKGEQDMLSELETRIRECYGAFLNAVTEDRDFWEIVLLEYYRWPLE